MGGCPICGSAFSVLLPWQKVAEECGVREQFIRARLVRPASLGELKDLTEFFHQEKADILACTACTLLMRSARESPPAETYAEEPYHPGVMERLYPQYLEAFHRKEIPYRSLLPSGARVLEIGSHYGAFLETAAEWGWRAEGVDVGTDTSRFAQSKGFTVHHGELASRHYPGGAFDGVFIWNCFEQVDDPKPLLRECRRVVKPNGLLAVRVPNGLFYAICQKLLSDGSLESEAAGFLIATMGYNNLLGFPYLFGYNRATLEKLISPLGFRAEGMLNAELITLPLPENPKWVEQQERAINREMRMLARSVLAHHDGTLTGPWIELWFRAE